MILFCNNNGWAISTPVSAQTRAETLADKAIGYGIPSARVDGGDVLAVFEATREAVARARAGDGPTFIEGTSTVVAVTSFGVNSTCAGTSGVYRIDTPDDLAWLSGFID